MCLCFNCNSLCASGDFITCGLCSLNFHLKCAKLNSACLKVIKSNKNLIFRCDTCSSVSISSCLAKISNALCSLKEIETAFGGHSNLHNPEYPKNSNISHVSINNAASNIAPSNDTADNNNLIITRSKARVADLNKSPLSINSSISFASAASSAGAITTNALTADVVTACSANPIGICSPSMCTVNETVTLSPRNTSLAADNPSAAAHATGTSAADNDNRSATNDESTEIGDKNSNNNAAWTEVKNRRRKKALVVVGSNDSTELSVAIRNKWLHLSSFDPQVSAEDIKKYVAKHAGIDADSLACYMLVKKDDPVGKHKRVNFKLGVSSVNYQKLLSSSLWPANVRVRPFRFFQKQTAQQQQM
ncbi:uncharacterized protein LOC118749485 [Rhagoletis pomonella]|uniref:uncharacterized protein LOC118749485 n=1 Tax=Rhagoletis pomonella TaxID=28610 RepID=UPI0017858BD8|nr:uncharacterized protein LOC118749485 [Rhagoletis pomonella]